MSYDPSSAGVVSKSHVRLMEVPREGAGVQLFDSLHHRKKRFNGKYGERLHGNY